MSRLRLLAGGTEARHWRVHRAALYGVVLLVSSALAAGCTSDRAASLSDEYETLSIGQVSRPEPVKFEPYFDTVSIAGRTYALPFSVQQLLDDGWVVHEQVFEGYSSSVAPFYSTNATLVRADDPNGHAENRSIDVTVVNTTPNWKVREDCDVWAVHFAEGVGTEPYPGVHAGASKAEVVAAMNIPSDPADVVAGESRLDIFRERLSEEQRSDLSAGSSSSRGTLPIRSAKVMVWFEDGVATGAYDVRYAPRTALTDGYVTMPAWGRPYSSDSRCSSLSYSWLLPGDLSSEPTIVNGRQILGQDWSSLAVYGGGLAEDSSSAANSYIDGGATYSIDGHDYAMAAANTPACHDIPAAGSQDAEDLVFAGLDKAAMVEGESQKALLWEGERSSAGVQVFRGTGSSTGQDTMQVVVNYCDWEHGTRLTFLYSLLALEPDTAISDGAANLLLTVASDATRSITYTPS